ncbi:EamA family transporter [Pelagibacteraceae bacterium]|jgi:O-acetylserine/cysteine efflux transporter|nr:EamA family transporter [Pelagibacteraceae bacterium]
MKTRDIFIALLVPVILGFGFVIAKPAMQYFPPYLLMGMRFTIPALILVWWFPLPKGLYFDLFKVSLIGSTLQYGLTYTGLNIIDASSAILLVQLEVPFGIIIAFFLLKEIPTIKNIVGLVIAFIGVFILTGAPNLEGKYIGVLLTIAGAFTWALGAVMAKPLSKKIGAFALMTWLCVFSGPMLLLVSLVFDGNPMQYILYANFNSWLTVIFLGFFMQPVGYAAWYYVLKKYPVNKVMPVLLILPVTGLITSIFLLGEDPPKQVFLGGIVIISGVALILFTKSKKKEERK